MPKVFVVQEALKRQPDGTFAPRFDLSPATEYGEIEYLLDPWAMVGTALQAAAVQFKNKLREFGDEDFILPIGDPAAMGVAIAVAAMQNHGRVKILRWDRHEERYIQLQVRI